jgi:hypothetical protein
LVAHPTFIEIISFLFFLRKGEFQRLCIKLNDYIFSRIRASKIDLCWWLRLVCAFSDTSYCNKNYLTLIILSSRETRILFADEKSAARLQSNAALTMVIISLLGKLRALEKKFVHSIFSPTTSIPSPITGPPQQVHNLSTSQCLGLSGSQILNNNNNNNNNSNNSNQQPSLPATVRPSPTTFMNNVSGAFSSSMTSPTRDKEAPISLSTQIDEPLRPMEQRTRNV